MRGGQRQRQLWRFEAIDIFFLDSTMENELSLHELPNEILQVILQHCAALSLPTLCFSTATCSKLRQFRHQKSISSLSNRSLSSIFDLESRVRFCLSPAHASDFIQSYSFLFNFMFYIRF
jgi:hypothetical protein